MNGLLAPLGLGRGDVVAVVGAGGKTTLVYGLAAEARRAGLSVIVTTTTHMGTLPEATTGPVLVESEGDGVHPRLAEALRSEGLVTVLGRRVRPDKLEGLSPERVDALRGAADLVLVEADGARGRSLKVPAPHEPVIPLSTTLVVVLAALDVLGQPLSPERVHRVELVALASGRGPGDPVDEEVVVRALADPLGYPCRVPAGARSVVFLNKAEDASTEAAAGRIASRLVPPYAQVVAGTARGGRVRILR